MVEIPSATALPSAKYSTDSPCEMIIVTYYDSPSVITDRVSEFLSSLEENGCCSLVGTKLTIVCKQGSPHSSDPGCSEVSDNVGGENYDIVRSIKEKYQRPPSLLFATSEQRLRHPPSLKRFGVIVDLVANNCEKIMRDWYFDGAEQHPYRSEIVRSSPTGEKFVEGHDFTLSHWLGGTRAKIIADLQAQVNSTDEISMEISKITNEGNLLPAKIRPFGPWAERFLANSPVQQALLRSCGVSWSQAMFVTTASGILQNTLHTYAELANQLSEGVNTEVGHYVERSYKYLFSHRPEETTTVHQNYCASDQDAP